VVINYFHAAQGRNNVVRLGRFRVIITVLDGQLSERVYTYSENPFVYNYYHPHVSDGRVCFGSAQTVAEKYKQELAIGPLLSLIQDVLITYNESSAYAMIYEFEQSIEDEKFEEWHDDDNDESYDDEPQEDPDDEPNLEF
jgi:hypothetical protein